MRKLFEKFILKPKYSEVNGQKVLSNKKALIALDQVSIILATALGVITNTLFVGLFTLAFFNNKALPSGTVIDIEYILAWFGLNFLIEIIDHITGEVLPDGEQGVLSHHPCDYRCPEKRETRTSAAVYQIQSRSRRKRGKR